MPVDERGGLSRRAALTGLTAMLATGCGRLAFMAANVPATFGAYQRRPNVSYGTDAQHRLDSAGAVDQSALLEFARDGLEIAGQQPGAERDEKRRVRQDQRPHRVRQIGCAAQVDLAQRGAFGGQSPLLSILTFGAVAITLAGYLGPIAVLLATLVVLANGLVAHRLSKRFTSSGGYFTYAIHSLSQRSI